MTRRRPGPLRTCLGCGAVDEQSALTRIVRAPTGALAVDPARCGGGRGGYLHRRAACWVRFARRKGPVRSFRAAVDRPARAALVAALHGGATSEG